MPQVIYSPEAIQDLQDIDDYIAQDDPIAAKRVHGAIVRQCRVLAQSPNMARARDDLAPGLRGWVVYRRYLIVFRPIRNGIEIARIVHGARHLPRLFGDEL